LAVLIPLQVFVKFQNHISPLLGDIKGLLQPRIESIIDEREEENMNANHV
jgi:hypothetical protein